MRYKQKSVRVLPKLGIDRYTGFQEEIFICPYFFYDEFSALISGVLSPLERIPTHIWEKGNATMASDRPIIESIISHAPGAEGHALHALQYEFGNDSADLSDIHAASEFKGRLKAVGKVQHQLRIGDQLQKTGGLDAKELYL